MRSPIFTAAALAVGALLTGGGAPPAAADSPPAFQLPFPCGETWAGLTTGNKVHESYEIDFNWGSGEDDRGKPVLAAAAGEVATAADQGTLNGYGNLVVLEHDGGYLTYYAHLDSMDVQEGDTVEQGQQIGALGDTSSKDDFSPHLHYEVRTGDTQDDIQPAVFDGEPFPHESTTPTSVTSANCGADEPSDPDEPDDPSGPRSFPVTATLDGRTEKTLSNHAAPDRYEKGTEVEVVCQDEGEPNYGGSTVWDLTVDGLWVADYYVKTGYSGFSPDLPRCELPKAYPALADLDGRSVKSLSDHTRPDAYRKGDLVEVVCQAHGGPTYGGSTIWNRTTDDLWVVDYYVDTDTTDFVPGIPRCDLDQPGEPEGAEEPQEPEEPGEDPDQGRTPAAELRLSTEGAAFIGEREGFRAEPYDDAGDACTIGYGHLITKDSCTDTIRADWGTITEERALDLLFSDATEAADAIRAALGSTPLHQHEFDALVSFTYNVGAGDEGFGDSNVRADLEADPPDYDAVPDHLMEYINVDDVPVCGLYVRRSLEGQVFASGTYDGDEPECPEGID